MLHDLILKVPTPVSLSQKINRAEIGDKVQIIQPAQSVRIVWKGHSVRPHPELPDVVLAELH